jgi:hypothetical protein
MKKILILSIALGCMLVSCSTTKAVKEKNTKESIYRNYVLYKCLVLGYGASADFSQDITPAVYNDFVEYSLGNTYIGRKLDSLANKKVAGIMPSPIADHGNKKAIFMHCLDYYNSDELKFEIRKFTKEFIEREKKALKN